MRKPLGYTIMALVVVAPIRDSYPCLQKASYTSNNRIYYFTRIGGWLLAKFWQFARLSRLGTKVYDNGSREEYLLDFTHPPVERGATLYA